jgi:hypothetical protein
MIKVYIASPYTIGDIATNVRKSLLIANDLINLGFIPFAPLLSHFQHLLCPQPYDVWLKLDMEWLLVCNCVLRFGGESIGADTEVSHAINNNIPVFYSIDEVCDYFETVRK